MNTQKNLRISSLVLTLLSCAALEAKSKKDTPEDADQKKQSEPTSIWQKIDRMSEEAFEAWDETWEDMLREAHRKMHSQFASLTTSMGKMLGEMEKGATMYGINKLDVSFTEKDNNLIATIKLGDIDPEKDIKELNIENNILYLLVEKQEKKEEKKDGTKTIQTSSSFRVMRALPHEIKQEAVTAEYNKKDGVLVITMPKTTHTKSPKIKIDIKK